MLTQPLHDHHNHCDDLFASAEKAANEQDWGGCLTMFRRFRNELEAHFATEEQLLFPAFEIASGMRAGPSQVMRFEHAQMRDLLASMELSIAEQNLGQFAGVADTLLVLMQQHNIKEENILYPMCDRTLADHGERLGDRLLKRLEATCIE
jgi:iron-sulfur cluster repair protein YtfE (RIC family)